MVKKAAQATPNRLLKAARKERGWTQREVADRIDAPLALNVSRWESGTAFPSAYYVERLCHTFGKSPRELGLSQLEDEAPPVQGTYSAGLLTLQDNSLPLPLTPLIGRQEEVKEVCALLRQPDARLVTLTGTGGIGKTRLAICVATDVRGDFVDGVFFVSLAALVNSALVLPTIAQTLGIKEIEHQSLLDVLQRVLREKRVLLLLDNFERLIPAALQIVELLARCPQLKVLVTSRAVLHVQGECEFPVSPLALPDLTRLQPSEALAQYAAILLFLQRAQAVKPGFRLTSTNAHTIAQICVRLDGLPLALELAAARIKLLSPQELLARLEHPLEVLTGGPHDLPDRQQTLRHTILWSYQLLDAQEQRLFQQLVVFVGGCTLDAAQAVCAALDKNAASFFERVISLLDKSLLQTIQQEGEESRLFLLETIREYGLECLAASGMMEAARRAHASYYLQFAEESEARLSGSQHGAWVRRLEREYDNMRAALAWSLEQGEAGHTMEMALRLGAALREFWGIRGSVREGRAFIERALARREGVAAPALAKAIAAAGLLADMQGDFGQAELWCGESLALFRALNDAQGAGRTLVILGDVALKKGEHAQARSHLDEALTLFREEDDTQGISDSLIDLANVSINQGEYISACELLEESLALARKAGYTSGVAASLTLLARAAFYRGDLPEAQGLFEESLALSRSIGYKSGIALALGLLGLVALVQGEHARARLLLEESLTLSRMEGWPERIAWGIYGLAWLAFFQQDYGMAHARFEEGLTLSRALDDKPFIAFYLEGLAGVASAQGQPAWAAQLWGAAETVRSTIDAAVPPVIHPIYEQVVTSMQAQLGADTFAAMQALGRSMTLEEVLAGRCAEGQTLSE